MTIYLDTNVFVFAFVEQTVKGEKARNTLDKVVRGQTAAMTSYLTFDELHWAVKKLLGREKAIEFSQAVFMIRNLKFIDVDGTVIRKAHELTEKYDIDPRDAIHAASAIIYGASSIMTDDKDFLALKEIKIERI